VFSDQNPTTRLRRGVDYYGEPEPDYRTAAVCRRGHAVHAMTHNLTDPVEEHCPRCGSVVLTAWCDHRIRGLPTGVYGRYSPPDFCDRCGAPHPWLSREGRIYLLQNMLDEEQLDPAAELEAREQLEALTNPELDEAEQERRWRKVKQLAPGLLEKTGAQRILESVISAAIRGQLGI
jgi:hypothetical protein